MEFVAFILGGIVGFLLATANNDVADATVPSGECRDAFQSGRQAGADD